MTVPASTRRAGPFIGNGSSTSFPFTFKVFAKTDIQVVKSESGVQTTLMLDVDYGVALNADQDNTPGGTVTYPLVGSPLASGSFLGIAGALPYNQALDLPGGGNFSPFALENALDRMMMQMQQLAELGSRALVFGIADTGNGALPQVVDRKGRLLGFDPVTGAPIATLPTAGDATALALDLLSTSTLTKGAGQMGLGATLNYVAGSLGAREVERVSPHDFPWLAPTNGVTDTTGAVQACLTWAAANGRGVDFTPGRTYKFSQLVFPANSNVRCAGAVFRSDGSLTVSGDLTVDIGANCTFDRLFISTPGTETNLDILRLGVGFWAEKVDVVSDTQRAGGGVTTTGQDVQIGILRTRKIDRPIHLYNQSTVAQTTGAFIAHLDIEDYVRGFRADFCAFTLGTAKMRGRSANASMTAGHNSVLIVGCAGWQMGDLYLADAGEHAFRIGGSPGTYARTRDFQVGNVVAERCGGCALKINPTLLVSAGVTETCDRFSFGNIVGIDVGDGTLAGNEELLRLTHVRRWRIASAIAYIKNETRSAQYALQINDSDDGEIGVLGGEALNSGFINVLGTSDTDGTNFFGGPVTDLRIGHLLGACTGNNAIGFNTEFNVGRIFIDDMDVTGFATNLLQWSLGTVVDVIEICGRVTGAVAPAVSGLPTSANLVCDIRYSNTRTAGKFNTLRMAVAAMQVTQAAFANGNVVPAGFFANAAEATAGVGNYGGSYEISRPGGGRRGAAIASKQTGANAYNMGLAFLAGANSSGTDELFELGVFKHNGSLYYANLPTFANNAAALGGGLVVGDSYKTATGELRIAV